MKDGVAPAPPFSQRPEFIWDPARARLLWANQAGLRVWGEDNLDELSSRWFAPDGATAVALTDLRATGTGVLRLRSGARTDAYQATAQIENGALRVILNDLEISDSLEAPDMSDGFELAPRPLAIFDAVGALITQNEADRLSFGPRSLADRFEDDAAAAQALGVALVDESHSKVFAFGEPKARWRVNFRRLRGPSGDVTVLTEFTDLPTRPPEEGADRQAVAAIAHDFRAPLMAICGFAELMASGAAGPEKHADYLAAIQKAASGLNDLADRFVAMGAERDAPLTLIDLNDLATNAASLFEISAEQAGATIRTGLDSATTPVLGDPVAASRIVQNLVSNALLHSGCASVSITVDRDAITVEDDGKGMEVTALEAALTPFGKAGRRGLGLPNCVALAASTGAKIDFGTAPGAGFSARLSFEP